ncbi:formyltransferase family protein [Streptomyces sporangiiformans]
MDAQRVHEAVLASGDPVLGATVHHVTTNHDEGPVIAQRQVPVVPDDTPKTLAARILRTEHLLLPTTVQTMALDHPPDRSPVPLANHRPARQAPPESQPTTVTIGDCSPRSVPEQLTDTARVAYLRGGHPDSPKPPGTDVSGDQPDCRLRALS